MQIFINKFKYLSVETAKLKGSSNLHNGPVSAPRTHPPRHSMGVPPIAATNARACTVVTRRLTVRRGSVVFELDLEADDAAIVEGREG